MSIEFQTIGTPGGNDPTLVFLHEGLGSVAGWRDFPARLCAHCQMNGLVYSRHGYGQSGLFEPSLGKQFMHQAASVELPALLAAHNINHPLLIGHSDGASIALIYAGEATTRPPRAVVAMAPHLFVETICTQAIAQLKADYQNNERLKAGMARLHRNGKRTFDTWTNAWLAPDFADWNIEAIVANIECPVLAIQGKKDQYGTTAQIQRLAQLTGRSQTLDLDDCGHSPHVDQLDVVLAAISAFVARVNTDQG